MLDLNLDVSKIDYDTHEFKYDLPKGFGPKRGTAWIKFVARPASLEIPKYRAAVEKLASNYRLKNLVLTKKQKERPNDAEFINSDIKMKQKFVENTVGGVYDNSIESWETNIQADGKNLEATRANYIALHEHANQDLVDVLVEFSNDLAKISNWQKEFEDKEEAKELKNSQPD